jgi:protein involved in polysaccharide export with SLBB domain
MIRHGLPTLVLCLLFSPIPVPASGQSSSTRVEEAAAVARRVEAGVLNPGDAVRITVWRKPEISGEYLVTGDGVIANPFYMDVAVIGLPLAAVADRIRVHIEQFETAPRVLVEPLYRVAVSGEVRQPSLYSLSPETTVEQAVLVAGGVTERARSERIVLVRGEQQIDVDLTRHDGGLARIHVQSGDQIVVPRQRSIVRDYVAPASSIIAASFSIINVWLRVR